MGVIQSYNTLDTELTKIADKIKTKYYMEYSISKREIILFNELTKQLGRKITEEYLRYTD